jgi:hypothetical protein
MLSLEAPECDHTDISITRLSEGCPNMQTMDLGGCPITNVSLIKLSEGCSNILSLDIYGCEDITDLRGMS